MPSPCRPFTALILGAALAAATSPALAGPPGRWWCEVGVTGDRGAAGVEADDGGLTPFFHLTEPTPAEPGSRRTPEPPGPRPATAATVHLRWASAADLVLGAELRWHLQPPAFLGAGAEGGSPPLGSLALTARW